MKRAHSRTVQSAAFAVIEYLFYPAILFATAPVLAGALGDEGFGLWMLLNASIAFSGVISAGISASLISLVSSERHRMTPIVLSQKIGGIWGSSLLVGSCVAGLAALSFATAAGRLIPDIHDRTLLLFTGFTSALCILLEISYAVFSSALKGAERFGVVARIEVTAKSIQAAGLISVAFAFHRVEAIYGVLVLAGAYRLWRAFRICMHELRLPTVRPALASRDTHLQTARWGWLQGMGGVLVTYGDRLLVGSTLGSASVTHYALAIMIPSQVHAIAAAANSIFFPKIRKLYAEEPTQARRLGRRLTMVNLVCASVMALVLYEYSKPILNAWLGSRFSEEIASTFDILVGAHWLWALSIAPYYVLLGTGQVRTVAIVTWIGGLLGIAYAILTIGSAGLAGVALGKVVYGLVALYFILAAHLALRTKRS